MTVLYAVTLGLPWDWRSGPSNSSEREQLLQMARGLPERTLLTMDAGFVGYDFWSELIEAQAKFVCRVGGNVRLLRRLGYVRHAEQAVFVWPDAAFRKGQPPLALRLECFDDGKEPVYLVTNEFDEQRLSTQDLQAVYQARWGVEVSHPDCRSSAVLYSLAA